MPDEMILTPEAQFWRNEFEMIFSICKCHLGHAPCGYCTHPGNPLNQAENEEAWMPADHYFEGVEHDYFVKPVQFGMVTDGEPQRVWVQAALAPPDVWTVYRLHNLTSIRNGRRYEPVSDHLDRDEALVRAEQLALEDKTLALLKGG